MNLKKTVLSFMAAGSILAGGFGSVMADTNDTAQGSAVINVVDDGAFDVQFCEGTMDFGDAHITAAQGTTVYGSISICYSDTESYRDGFQTYISSGNFTSNTPIQVPSGSGNYFIPAANFQPTHVYNTLQGQWGAGTGYDIGDIGGYNGAVNVPGGAGLAWAGGNFSDRLKVGYAWNGAGTIATSAPISAKVVVPSRIADVQYTASMTVEVVTGQP